MGATKKATTAKNKSGVTGGKAKQNAPAKATRKAEAAERPTIEDLRKAADKLPSIIRPTYEEFEVPSGGDKVIIRKLPIGVRDTITEFATKDGVTDPGIYAGKMIQESLVHPKLTYEQVDEMDVEDFNVIHHHANELSYRKVGEVVKRFLDGQARS